MAGRNHKRIVGVSFAMLLVFLAMGVVMAIASVHTVERTAQLPEGGKLRVDGGSGVTVRGGGKPGEVLLKGTVRLWTWRRTQAEAESSIEIAQAFKETQVSVTDGGWILFPIIFMTRVQVELVVPDGTPVEVATASGPVSVQGLRGDLSVSTGSGAVSVEGFNGGRLLLSSNRGKITFSGEPGEESIITTRRGNLQLLLPDDRAYRLQQLTQRRKGQVSLPYSDGIIGEGTPVGSLIVNAGKGSLEIGRR